MKNNIKVLIIIALLLGYSIGYMVGNIRTLDWCVETGAKYLNIEVDEKAINSLLNKYGGKLSQHNPNLVENV